MYIGHSLKLAEMELDERRRDAGRHRLVRESRDQSGSDRVRRLPSVLEGVRQFALFARWTRTARAA